MVYRKCGDLIVLLCVFLNCSNVHGFSMYAATDMNSVIYEGNEDLSNSQRWHVRDVTKTDSSSTRSWLSWLEDFLPGPRFDLRDCINSTEGGDFPDDLFTDEQLRQGALILHFIGGIYSFTLLAFVCNDFFIPSVECICEDLNLPKDVAAATFMAAATSCPELFVNVMSTFITESDLGLGTIVGSSLFNTLGVGAVGGIAARQAIKISRWPVTRDCLIYCVNVAVLVSMTWDNRIEWYEATILLCLYISYFVFMFTNKRVFDFAKKLLTNKGMDIHNKPDSEKISDEDLLSIHSENRYTHRVSHSLYRASIRKSNNIIASSGEIPNVPVESIWRYPREESIQMQFWFLLTWPLNFILKYTIPSPVTYRKAYPVTFLMCIIWIGVNSYFVSWMITTIGRIFEIPDSIMGMTFLAFGGCLPEACSIFIMSRKGEGGMGVSNSLGANSLAILFSLGIPWFVKCMILKSNGEDAYIEMSSSGLDYIIISLFFAVASLYIVLSIGKFELKKATGCSILIIYFIFITLAVLLESGVFFEMAPC